MPWPHVGCREGSEARGVFCSLFFPRHPAYPQCGFHSHCLLPWLPATALTLLIYTTVFVGHSIFCLLSCVSYILLHWGFCLFSINIVYEIHINFSSSSFSSTAVVSYFLNTCLFYTAGKLECLRCFALTILKQCFYACVCLLMYTCQTRNLGVDFVGHKLNASSALGGAYRLLSKAAVLSSSTTSYVWKCVTYISFSNVLLSWHLSWKYLSFSVDKGIT